MSEQALDVRQAGTVTVAAINRPAKANSLNREVIDALDALAADLERPPTQPTALVLTGNGRVFSAGAEITELDDISGEQAKRQMQRGQAVFDRLAQLPVAVIAAINGVALGGGLELAMAADIRICARTARLGQAEINLGNLPGWGGTQRLPRLVGRGRATEMILTGAQIDAEQAYRIGLVERLADDALSDAIALGEEIAARNPVAVAGAKRAIHTGLEVSYEEGLRVEAEAVAACCETEMQHEAVRAFLERTTRRSERQQHVK